MHPRWALAALLVIALPTSSAHGVFEASELEVHLTNDEGSDAIEPYGGYDIQDLFIGFANDPAVGNGSTGDGFYLRIPLYGLPENTATPQTEPWTVTVTIGSPAGDIVRTLSTDDGVEITSDFDALLYEIDGEERSTHIQRAFVSWDSAGVRPGAELGPFLVESRVGGDLRDIAPGGIPVPGTNGATTYPDPTQIDGEGVLVDKIVAEDPSGYVTINATANSTGTFDVFVASNLKDGGQHITIHVIDAPGWDVQLGGNTGGAVDGGGNLTFSIAATPSESPGEAIIEVRTDVGGRSVLVLSPTGDLLLPDGTTVAAATPLAVGNDAPLPVWTLFLALAFVLRRR